MLGFLRPSRARNSRRLQERRESIGALQIRDATAADIPALAALHVKSWHQTFWFLRNQPTYLLRERQWREQFEKTDGSWFCFVVENRCGQLVGFVKGNRYDSSDLPAYAGELNKIYLLREYQRLGLGRRLVGHTAERFLSQGIDSMVLFATPGNPSCSFYDALGGERLYGRDGAFHGGYGWRDLRRLAAICPIE